jgi:hypothetical protein
MLNTNNFISGRVPISCRHLNSFGCADTLVDDVCKFGMDNGLFAIQSLQLAEQAAKETIV